jgi:hypothetical protein
MKALVSSCLAAPAAASAALSLAALHPIVSDRPTPRGYKGRYRPEIAALLAQEMRKGTPGTTELLIIHAAPLVEFLAARWGSESGDLLSMLYLAVRRGSADPGDAARYALRRARLSDRRRAIREEVSTAFAPTSTPPATAARADLRAALGRLSDRDRACVLSWAVGEEIPRGAEAESKARTRALARLRVALEKPSSPHRAA